jgi:hypothetical protein
MAYTLPGGIPGGNAEKEGKRPSDFSAAEVAAGQKVEREHTDDSSKTTDIAIDHLMEAEAKQEKASAAADDFIRTKLRGDALPPISAQRYAKLPYDDQPQPHDQPVMYQTDPDLNIVKQASIPYTRGIATALYAVNLR